jgi:hypothetical protein
LVKPFAALGRRGSKMASRKTARPSEKILEYMTKADRDRRLNNDGGEPLRAKLDLSIANCEPLQDREALKFTIEAQNSHHNGMPLRLRPSGAVGGAGLLLSFDRAPAQNAGERARHGSTCSAQGAAPAKPSISAPSIATRSPRLARWCWACGAHGVRARRRCRSDSLLCHQPGGLRLTYRSPRGFNGNPSERE